MMTSIFGIQRNEQRRRVEFNFNMCMKPYFMSIIIPFISIPFQNKFLELVFISKINNLTLVQNRNFGIHKPHLQPSDQFMTNLVRKILINEAFSNQPGELLDLMFEWSPLGWAHGLSFHILGDPQRMWAATIKSINMTLTIKFTTKCLFFHMRVKYMQCVWNQMHAAFYYKLQHVQCLPLVVAQIQLQSTQLAM